MEKQVSEGSLHKWFKGSKSKDGKGGWVNVVTGGTCASDEPGEGTPKCVSSAKRASMTKAERLSAARRKKKADPNQQQKSGAAKPTYVSTDKPKKKKMKETYERSLTPLTEKAKKCWPGYEKKGTKKMFGKTYNNCVKKEEVILERQKDSDKQRLSQERGRSNYGKASIRNVRATGMGGNAADPAERLVAMDTRHKAHKEKRGVKTKGMKEAYSANPAQQAAIAIAKKKKKEDDMVAKKKKQKMYAGYEPQGEVIDEKNRGDQETRKKAKGYDSFTEKRPISKSEQGTREVVGRRNTTSAMNRSGMGMAKPERETKERGERHKADRGKKTKGTKEGHSGSAYPQRSHTMDTMYPHKKTARLKAKVAAKKGMGEAYTVTNADKKANTKAYQDMKAGKKNVKTGEPMYKAADHMKEEDLRNIANINVKSGDYKNERSLISQIIGEEGYDIARDMGRVKPSKDKKDGTTMPPSEEMKKTQKVNKGPSCLLYTSPSPRDVEESRMPSSA